LRQSAYKSPANVELRRPKQGSIPLSDGAMQTI
jgi:hypothetical protein